MIRVLKCMLAFVIYILIFDIFGTFVTNRLKWKLTQVERLLWGFFIYYTLFQCVYLPFVLLKQSFTFFSKVWLIVLGICVVMAAAISIWKKDSFVSIPKGMFHLKTTWIYYVILILLGVETQQNSDITYRVYDYDRLSEGKPRELHINKSYRCYHNSDGAD